PERGVVGPSDFIPVAEENGLIEPIGRWVLEHACRQATQWARERPDAAPMCVSVNLSMIQIARHGLADLVAEEPAATRLQPACLRLEVPESETARHDST